MLVGRDTEISRVVAVLEAARQQESGALVLVGDPGVGKTALLREVREHATDMTVLGARGFESESELPFAGLHQLLRPVLHMIDQLPRPQAQALRGALGLADHPGEDRFLVSIAALTLLAELSEGTPVLCLVDDTQWLDASSTDALLFVARRLAAERLAIVFASRAGEDDPLPAAGLPVLRLDGLSRAASSALLGDAFSNLAPAVRDALVEQSQGNPLSLLELPAALSDGQRRGSEALPPTLPLTGRLQQMFVERVVALPRDVRELLGLVAAEAGGSLATVLAAAERVGVDLACLQRAEEERLLTVLGDRIEMRHPLLRAAIYQSMSFMERSVAHRTLAEVLDPELARDERAWHLSAATPGTDESIAGELEGVAQRAQARSAHAAAATAFERAATHSVESAQRARRLVAAADAAWHAGQPDRASALIATARPLVGDAILRADLDHLAGLIQMRCGGLVEAAEILMAAADAIAELDTRKALEMLLEAREAAGWAGHTPYTVECDRRAATFPRSSDPVAQFIADLLVGVGRVYEGDTALGAPLLHDVITRAYEIDEPGWVVWAATGARAIGDEAAEAALMRRALSLARTSGAVDKLIYVLLGYVLMGLLGGRPGAAAEATEGATLARAAGLPNAASAHLAMLAWFAAATGDADGCRTLAAEALDLARVGGGGFASSVATWGLGLLDLSQRAGGDAVEHLRQVSEARPGEGHPFFAIMSAPDLVEARALVGDLAGARAAADTFQQFAAPGAPPWALALAARCRALASDDDDVQQREFDQALQLHDAGDRPLDRARTQLLAGEHLRRQRKRVEARDLLRSALAEFERVGADTWADRARAELRATGETSRRRDPSGIWQLTPQESQIVRFVAEGLSNKDVAAQLFLSPRTVEYHLRKVFTKLGIASRAELILQGGTMAPLTTVP